MQVQLGLGILLVVIASCAARDIPTRAGIYMYIHCSCTQCIIINATHLL